MQVKVFLEPEIQLGSQKRKARSTVKESKSFFFINAADGRKPFGRGRGSVNKPGGRGPSRVCTYCGKLSHTGETCYKKHGYPPTFGRGTS